MMAYPAGVGISALNWVCRRVIGRVHYGTSFHSTRGMPQGLVNQNRFNCNQIER